MIDTTTRAVRFHSPRMPRSRTSVTHRITPTAPTSESGVRPSPPLTEFPKRVVLISDKNFANINTKMLACLQSAGIDTRFIHAGIHNQNDDFVRECFDIDHAKILAIYYDPGTVHGNTTRFTPTVNAPIDVPWGLIHGSSMYRVDNIRLETEAMHMANTIRKGLYCKKTGLSSKLIVNGDRMKSANRFFDSMTPLVMCGTEDLLSVNPKSVFLGQPQPFEPYKVDKNPTKIVHITANVATRNVKKGTNIIESAFRQIDFMDKEIIGYVRVPNSRCLSLLDGAGMAVSTMTSWDYGMGYVSLEALSRSCLVMAKNSKNASLIGSPIVNVITANDIVNKARYFHNNRAEYDALRKAQYDWGKAHFSPQAIAARFKEIVSNGIANRWRTIDTKYRRIF